MIRWKFRWSRRQTSNHTGWSGADRESGQRSDNEGGDEDTVQEDRFKYPRRQSGTGVRCPTVFTPQRSSQLCGTSIHRLYAGVSYHPQISDV